MGNHVCRYKTSQEKCKEEGVQKCMGMCCGRWYCKLHSGYVCGYRGCKSKVCSRCIYLTNNTMCKDCCKITRHMKIIYH